MITLYGYDTINTLKVLMFLCEAGLIYEFKPINIRAGEQHSAEFRAINPAGKVPVIWDGDMHQTESNSILLSLAQKTGWGLMEGSSLNAKLIAWLFYQASTQGPYFGQIEYWSRLAKSPNSDALAQYSAIANRSIEYLNEQLNSQNISVGIHIASLTSRCTLGCVYINTLDYPLNTPKTCRVGVTVFWQEQLPKKP
mgnify:CR=1 FL=1